MLRAHERAAAEVVYARFVAECELKLRPLHTFGSNKARRRVVSRHDQHSKWSDASCCRIVSFSDLLYTILQWMAPHWLAHRWSLFLSEGTSPLRHKYAFPSLPFPWVFLSIGNARSLRGVVAKCGEAILTYATPTTLHLWRTSRKALLFCSSSADNPDSWHAVQRDRTIKNIIAVQFSLKSRQPFPIFSSIKSAAVQNSIFKN